MTPSGVSPIARSRPIWRRWASTRPPIAVASVKAAASRASTVVVWRIVSSRRASSVRSFCCVRQSSVRTEPAGAERAARSANAFAAPGSVRRTPRPNWSGWSAVASPSTSAGSPQPPSADPADAPMPTTRSSRRVVPTPAASVSPTAIPSPRANSRGSRTSPGARAARPSSTSG